MKNLYDNDTNNEDNNLVSEGTEMDHIAGDGNIENDSMRSDLDIDKVLVGIFETENEAINVIRRLKETGYQEDEITVVAKDKEQMENINETTDADTKTPDSSEKVGKGATIGAVLGGVAAALPALGLLIIPGVGPLLAAGPIALILGGVVAGGVAGGLVGVLVQLGVGEDDAKKYNSYIEQGKILVLVENREGMSENVNTSFRENNSLILDRNLKR